MLINYREKILDSLKYCPDFNEFLDRKFKNHTVRNKKENSFLYRASNSEYWVTFDILNGNTLVVLGDMGEGIFQWYGDKYFSMEWIASLNLDYFNGKKICGDKNSWCSKKAEKYILEKIDDLVENFFDYFDEENINERMEQYGFDSETCSFFQNNFEKALDDNNFYKEVWQTKLKESLKNVLYNETQLEDSLHNEEAFSSWCSNYIYNYHGLVSGNEYEYLDDDDGYIMKCGQIVNNDSKHFLYALKSAYVKNLEYDVNLADDNFFETTWNDEKYVGFYIDFKDKNEFLEFYKRHLVKNSLGNEDVCFMLRNSDNNTHCIYQNREKLFENNENLFYDEKISAYYCIKEK